MKRIVYIVAGLLLFAASASAGNNVPKYVGVTSTGVPFASLFDSTKVPQADGTIMTVTGVDGSATTCAAGSVTRIAQRIDGAWICNPAGGSGAAIPDPLNLNQLRGTGINPTISGYHGSLDGSVDPTANLNLACTGASVPYPFCSAPMSGTFTPASDSNAIGVCASAVGSASLTACSGVSSFQNGHGVMVPQAGPTPTNLTAPTKPTDTAACADGCSTTWLYKACAVDAHWGISPCSPASNGASNNATLDPTHANLETTGGGGSAAIGYLWYRSSDSGATWSAVTIGLGNLYDRGTTIPSWFPSGIIPTTPPTILVSQTLTSTIASGAGTAAMTLADSAGSSISGAKVIHDDTAALASVAAIAQEIRFPSASHFNIHAPIALTINGQIVHGGGSETGAGTIIQNIMPATNTFTVKGQALKLSDMVIETPLFGVEMLGSVNSENNILDNIAFYGFQESTGSYGVEIDAPGNANYFHPIRDLHFNGFDNGVVEGSNGINLDHLTCDNFGTDCVKQTGNESWESHIFCNTSNGTTIGGDTPHCVWLTGASAYYNTVDVKAESGAQTNAFLADSLTHNNQISYVNNGGAAVSDTGSGNNVTDVGAATQRGLTSLEAAAFSTLAPNAITHTSGGTDTADLSKGAIQTLTVNDGNAFTFANPTNPTNPQWWTLRIANTSGGAVGAITWGASIKSGTPTLPATGKSRVFEFYWDGTNHWLTNQSASDL